MSLVYAHGVEAQTGDVCEQFANELKGRFGERYLELDLKCGRVGPCYGTPDLTYDSSGGGEVGTCGHLESQECDASYKTLAYEEAAGWEALYAQCPELLTPTPIDGVVPDDTKNNGPLFTATTSAELLKRVKSLEKKLVRAKKEAKRGKARRCLVPRTR
jgi:hypothetical protein